jgi:site-specific DNA-methyltransferase (adenine-specific)
VSPKIYHPFDDTKIPDAEYFSELRRVSKNQIIWGGNYFLDFLTSTECMIFWDKCRDGLNFADGEIAWTSFKQPTRRYTFKWNGMLQGDMKNKEDRFHPTQKPVALYRWIFHHYAKQGDKILDTHLGSGSSRIAAYDAGLDFVGYEIDETYFRLQEERFARHTSQMSLFID